MVKESFKKLSFSKKETSLHVFEKRRNKAISGYFLHFSSCHRIDVPLFCTCQTKYQFNKHQVNDNDQIGFANIIQS